MAELKDNSLKTLEELLTEEKALKKNKIYSAFGIGFLIGIMVYGLIKNGFGLIYTGIPLILMYGIYKNSEIQKGRLHQIEAEIAKRK
jgi:hypothetical protein